ncbi:MAG: PAS domain S-box protein [Candidatus Aminicenantes bacterium]|nr:PAS domain S-box protein [Candidatus Aminicenantes bacterium]MDH5383230.1 PAS domain S-box protein [Candidatus Aminicenantes bacterium]MDH5706445.1 PAS domain S-box protein [Candidatus Aminicenantes bacterium]
MNENNKSKEQQLEELMELHQRITELQKLEIERELAEKKLRKIEDKIHKMFNKAKEVVTIIQDRQIKYVNPFVAELIGYTPEELIGASFAHYIHPDELPRLAKYYLQRIAGEDVPNVYTTVIKHKDGSDVPIEIKASVIQYQGRLADFAIVRKVAESYNT